MTFEDIQMLIDEAEAIKLRDFILDHCKKNSRFLNAATCMEALALASGDILKACPATLGPDITRQMQEDVAVWFAFRVGQYHERAING